MIRETTDPLELFAAWYGEAATSEPNDPSAMALATVGPDGTPAVRMVLLKDYDADGFVFYTNYESRKGSHLLAHPKAALLFHWKSLRRQVRVEGRVSPVSPAEADAYFHSRARASQIGAWASIQSEELASREVFEQRCAEFDDRFAGGPVPRPPHWSGYRLRAERVEFWYGMPFRLHDRHLWQLRDGRWSECLLYP